MLAAKAATASIPIRLSEAGADPVELGVVASLNRPGGNITGVSNFNDELGPKRLRVLHELVPNATRTRLLINPTNPMPSATFTHAVGSPPWGSSFSPECQRRARASMRLFASLIQQRTGAVIIDTDRTSIRSAIGSGAGRATCGARDLPECATSSWAAAW